MVPTFLVALGLAVGLIAPLPVPDLTLNDATGKPRTVRPSEAKAVALLFQTALRVIQDREMPPWQLAAGRPWRLCSAPPTRTAMVLDSTVILDQPAALAAAH